MLPEETESPGSPVVTEREIPDESIGDHALSQASSVGGSNTPHKSDTMKQSPLPDEEQLSYPDGERPSSDDEHSPEPNEIQPPLPNEEQPPQLNEEQPPVPVEEVPPLPSEPPPLPEEAPSTDAADDGWQPMWDEHAQAYYFYNRFTNISQWHNPRIPDATQPAHIASGAMPTSGGYNPAIHGDYDPNADYAKSTEPVQAGGGDTAPGVEPTNAYAATGAFNRFTGKWQNADFTPDRFSDAAKSGRQMSAFFDVDAAANTHDGRSLKAERANKKVSKKELEAFKSKRREKKEEKRRAWLRD